MAIPRRSLLLLCSVVLAGVAFSDTAARRSDSVCSADGAVQLLRLDEANGSFAIAVAANADLYNLPQGIRRVVVRIEVDSSASETLLDIRDGTLVLVPRFSVAAGRSVPTDRPAWHSEQAWAEGEPSSEGRVGLSALTILDALVNYLKRSSHFPGLQEVVFVGRGTTAGLVERHGMRPQAAPSFRIRHVGARQRLAQYAAQALPVHFTVPVGDGHTGHAVAQHVGQ
ncbi:hypothetical protein CXK94_07405 [Stutzerimonas stutzeri]|uniref:Uncharacterized protein n=1 Tax=Stutzerimonas stutzeri TaxID=316 RepID=A0A2N8T5H6_STUST|nr:hypothetical protein [Stutzerimonas stutzeri]MCQ4324775.1 hypothetical protein [Stutzerimonas stutzeri]PNG10017.1 hypothetical protein CXK94_07405 [Stutzerimonas stutzeri]